MSVFFNGTGKVMIKDVKRTLNGITPEHIVTEDNQKLKYWCVMEMRTIDGETRTETYDDISLEDFEVIYGGIVDLITSVELRQMSEQVGCNDENL